MKNNKRLQIKVPDVYKNYTMFVRKVDIKDVNHVLKKMFNVCMKNVHDVYKRNVNGKNRQQIFFFQNANHVCGKCETCI